MIGRAWDVSPIQIPRAKAGHFLRMEDPTANVTCLDSSQHLQKVCRKCSIQMIAKTSRNDRPGTSTDKLPRGVEFAAGAATPTSNRRAICVNSQN
jgi:hypothetical protein